MIPATRTGWYARTPLIVGALGLVMLGVSVAVFSPAGLLDAEDALVHTLRNLGLSGAAVLGILQILVAVTGILPASLLGMAAGAIYGFVTGFLLASISTMAGAELAFILSRSLFRPTVERLFATRPRLRNLDALIAKDGWRLVCLLRISPIMPFSATSYILGLSSISMRWYTLGTLASLPSLCAYVFIGTLAEASLSAWISGRTRWVALSIGIIATMVLMGRLGKIIKSVWFPANRDDGVMIDP